jgi:NAD(P)-dependent dehydrogenase (short-subunit alcohol dehydrogenase family)
MSWTLVTGGAKGLGAEICRKIASQGFQVVVHYNSSELEAKKVAEDCRSCGVKAEIIQGDFSNQKLAETFLQSYLSKFSNTQNLINNVGNYFIGSALETSLEQWVEIFQNNLYTPLTLIQSLQSSIKKLQGSIVNIGIAGIMNIRGDVYSTAYSCAKTGLWMLTKSLAVELAPYKARVNMVSPGYLETAIDLPKDLQKLPMNRAATLNEVAAIVAFLLGREASYVTGQNIEAAGGIRLS